MSEKDLFQRRQDFFLQPSQTIRGGIVAGLVIGIIAVVAAVFMAKPVRLWNAVLLNSFFFFSIALGGIAFSGMQDVIGALWGRPIKRIHESFAAFLPLGGGILIVILLCILFDVGHARDLYSWMKDPALVESFFGKNTWLQPICFAVRDIAAILIICGLAFWQLRNIIRRDLVFLKGDQAGSAQIAQLAKDRLRHWSAPILFVYALCYSLLTFDLVMSLSPLWFSTLWAGWLFSIMMQTLMAMLLIFLFALRPTSVGEFYTRKQFHDIGKLLHGFTVFFAYLTYAHILTYWFGNVPEETEYFLERLHGTWYWIVVIVPIFAFVIPLYALIFKAAKWTAPVTVSISIMILIAQWFVYVGIFVPSSTGNYWTSPWIDLGVLSLMLAMFLLCFFQFAKRIPMLSLADPLLVEALHGDHH